MNRINKIFCWLGFHDWLCLHRYWWESQATGGSTITGWRCSRCDKQRTEQWDGI